MIYFDSLWFWFLFILICNWNWFYSFWFGLIHDSPADQNQIESKIIVGESWFTPTDNSNDANQRESRIKLVRARFFKFSQILTKAETWKNHDIIFVSNFYIINSVTASVSWFVKIDETEMILVPRKFSGISILKTNVKMNVRVKRNIMQLIKKNGLRQIDF